MTSKEGYHASIYNRSSYRRIRSSNLGSACFGRSYPGWAHKAERPVLAEAKRVRAWHLGLLAIVRRKGQQRRRQRIGSSPGISSSSWLTLLGPTGFCGAFFMTERVLIAQGAKLPIRGRCSARSRSGQEFRPSVQQLTGSGCAVLHPRSYAASPTESPAWSLGLGAVAEGTGARV